MDEEPTDPYEQQLLAVFKSCSKDSQNQVDKNGLISLCLKLELDENHKNSVLDLLDKNPSRSTITFYEFKDAFLALLGKSEEVFHDCYEKESIDQKSISNLSSLQNCQHVQTG